MADLRTNLKKKLLEHNISASAFEKKAGIRPSSLQNILQGRSKNPSIEVLGLAAQAFNCTISELLGEKPGTTEIESFCHTAAWDIEKYLQAAQAVLNLYAQKQIKSSKRALLHAIEQVYTYSVQYKKKIIDKDFVDWIVLQLLESDKADER